MRRNKIGDGFLMKNYMRIISMSLIFLILLAGCSINNEVNRNIEDGKSNELEVYDEPINNIDSWIGDYTFSEFIEPDINMFYSIVIYKFNDEIYADISVNGFQRLDRVKASVKGDGDFIELSFLEYLPDNLMELYEKDDILLLLEKKESDIYTSWGEIQPISPENMKQGIYFVKTEE